MGPGRGTAALLDAIANYLDEWQLLLRAGQPGDERVRTMQRRAEELRSQADAAAAGGLAHHLGVCIQCMAAPALNRRGFQEALRNLSEVAWQLKREQGPASAKAVRGGGVSAVALPPMIIDGPARGSAANPLTSGASSAPVPPPPISIRAPAASPSGQGAGVLGFGTPRASEREVSSPDPSLRSKSGLASPVRSPASSGPSAPPARAPAPAAPVRDPAHPFPLEGPAEVESGGGRGRSNLLVATMFGLRAFGRAKGAKPGAGAGAEAGAAAAQAVPRASAGAAGLLGLGRRSKPGLDAPPRWVGSGAGGLPELPTAGGSSIPAPPVAGDDLDARLRGLRAGKGRGGAPQARPAERGLEASTMGRASSGAQRSAGRASSGAQRSAGRASSGAQRSAGGGVPRVPWWIGLVAVAFVALIVVVLLVWRGPRVDAPAAAAPRESAAPSTTELPKSRLLDNKERLRVLISLVHDYGGEESPELADLLDEEAALLDEAMSLRCSGQGDECEGAVPIVAGTLHGAAPQNQIQHLFRERRIQTRSRGDRSVTPTWLAGLEIPAIGVEDEPEVKHWVEYFTEHSVGRERFQTLLFRCGEYHELIERTLVRHGLPTDLMALVLTESGCVPDIESPVGARGLWQFMPATARAYHLHVKDGVVDERISPPKATEAAVRFLADLYRKMGSWEFAMASYNMGPFGLAARIRRAGGDVTFWDLAAAGMLPEETAKYVPRIQGYALILKNLAHFNFSAAQMRSPEPTSELEVPPGTRLGQVARSVGTTLNQIKLLNPDLVGTTVPDLPGSRFLVHVPKDLVFRGRSALPKLLAEGDQADRCVSSEFDWGRQRFTAKMAAQCRQSPSR